MVLLSLVVELPDDAEQATVDMAIGSISRKVAAGQPVHVAVSGLDVMLNLTSLAVGATSPAAIGDERQKRSSWFGRRPKTPKSVGRTASFTSVPTPKSVGRTASFTSVPAASSPTSMPSAPPESEAQPEQVALTDETAQPATPMSAPATRGEETSLVSFVNSRDAAAEKAREKERVAREERERKNREKEAKKRQQKEEKKSKGGSKGGAPPVVADAPAKPTPTPAPPATDAAQPNGGGTTSGVEPPARSSSSLRVSGSKGTPAPESPGPIKVPLERRLSLLQAYFAPSDDDDDLDDDADDNDAGESKSGGKAAAKPKAAAAPSLTAGEKASPLYGGGHGGGGGVAAAEKATGKVAPSAEEKKKAQWPTKGPTKPANESVVLEGQPSPSFGGRPLRWDD